MGLCLMLLFLAGVIVDVNADCHLVEGGVLHDIRAQVGALDSSKILLVALPVTGVLVQHVGGPGLYLALDDVVPQLLGLDSLPGPALLLDTNSTVLVEPGCTALVTPQGDIQVS